MTADELQQLSEAIGDDATGVQYATHGRSRAVGKVAPAKSPAPRPIWRGHLRLAARLLPRCSLQRRHDRAGIRLILIDTETGKSRHAATSKARSSGRTITSCPIRGFDSARVPPRSRRSTAAHCAASSRYDVTGRATAAGVARIPRLGLTLRLWSQCRRLCPMRRGHAPDDCRHIEIQLSSIDALGSLIGCSHHLSARHQQVDCSRPMR